MFRRQAITRIGLAAASTINASGQRHGVGTSQIKAKGRELHKILEMGTDRARKASKGLAWARASHKIMEKVLIKN